LITYHFLFSYLTTFYDFFKPSYTEQCLTSMSFRYCWNIVCHVSFFLLLTQIRSRLFTTRKSFFSSIYGTPSITAYYCIVKNSLLLPFFGWSFFQYLFGGPHSQFPYSSVLVCLFENAHKNISFTCFTN